MNTLIENSSPVFSVKKYLKKFDLTGVKFHPRIFKQKKYVSIPGSIITIISFAILIYRIIISINTILNRTNFKVTTKKDLELNKTFTVNNLNIQIYLLAEKELLMKFTNYIEEVYSNKTNFEIMKGYYIPCYNYDFNNSSFLITNEVFESLNSFNA